MPVINKIDLLKAMLDDVAEEVEELLGVPAEDIPRISAKTDVNVEAQRTRSSNRCRRLRVTSTSCCVRWS